MNYERKFNTGISQFIEDCREEMVFEDDEGKYFLIPQHDTPGAIGYTWFRNRALTLDWPLDKFYYMEYASALKGLFDKYNEKMDKATQTLECKRNLKVRGKRDAYYIALDAITRIPSDYSTFGLNPLYEIDGYWKDIEEEIQEIIQDRSMPIHADNIDMLIEVSKDIMEDSSITDYITERLNEIKEEDGKEEWMGRFSIREYSYYK